MKIDTVIIKKQWDKDDIDRLKFVRTFMHALGYPASNQGLCSAITFMSGAAGLAGDQEIFDARIKLLAAIMTRSYAEFGIEIHSRKKTITEKQDNNCISALEII